MDALISSLFLFQVSKSNQTPKQLQQQCEFQFRWPNQTENCHHNQTKNREHNPVLCPIAFLINNLSFVLEPAEFRLFSSNL